MGRKGKNLPNLLEYLALKSTATIVSSFSLETARRVGILLAKIFGRFKKKQARENITSIFTDSRFQEIFSGALKNLGMGLGEFIKIPEIVKKYSVADLEEKIIRFEREEVLRNLVKEGRGVLALTGHFGNWELLGAYTSMKGYNLGVVVERQWNYYSDEWINSIRRKSGEKIFYNEERDLRKLLSHIKEGGILGVLADQTYFKQPVKVEFFGRYAYFAPGPAVLHLKYRVPVLPTLTVREKTGFLRVKFEKPIYPEDSLKETDGLKFKDRVVTLTQKFAQIYEKWIKEYPESWFNWFFPVWRDVGSNKYR